MKDIGVSVIIQGPTNYCREILPAYRDYPHVIWSTWEDEPKENLDLIRMSGITVNLVSKPINSGFWNINLQCKSTYEGLLTEKEVFNNQYCLKVRSDFYISNVELLCKRFIEAGQDLNFLGWANLEDGFVLDYIVFGRYENMTRFWGHIDCSENGKPYPEMFLMRAYYQEEDVLRNLKPFLIERLPILDGIAFFWHSRNIDLRLFSSKLYLRYTKWRGINRLKYSAIRFMRNRFNS